MSTTIEWTNATWNPLAGCTPVSPGCLNCYAARMAMRLEGMGTKGYQAVIEPETRRIVDIQRQEMVGYVDASRQKQNGRTVRIAEVKGGRPVFTGSVRTIPDKLIVPLHWRQPRMIFVNSMSDLFHEAVPFEFVDQVFAVMALCPQHTFQVLTKRPERMAEYLNSQDRWPHPHDMDQVNKCHTTCRIDVERDLVDIPGKFPGDHRCQPARKCVMPWPLPNVWLGTSVEDQERANQRIPHLLKCPAAVRFLSCEPLLGAIEFSDVTKRSDAVVQLGKKALDGINWVIAGGESGPKSRPCNIEWIRSIVQQCKAAGVPCFVKQLGKRIIVRNDRLSEWPRDGDGLNYASAEVDGEFFQGDDRVVWTEDPKGGTPSEWPQDLRVREMPVETSNEKR